MLAQKPVGADCFLALNVARERLRVGFKQARVDEFLAPALFKPFPCFNEQGIRAKRFSVLLPRAEVVAWRGYVLAV